MNIIQAIEDPKLFGGLFKDIGTWNGWLIYLSALFGLPVEGVDAMSLFGSCTGLVSWPAERIRESFVICGRRSGKSFISSIIAVYMACFKDWRPYLSAGEVGWIFIIAVDRTQARVIKRYVSGILNSVSVLKGLVEKETQDEIWLRNRVAIGIKTLSFRTLRGYTVLCGILEEIAFWRSEESANPDKEVLAAIRPALATIPDGLLIGLSTPYSRAGVLFEQWRQNYGKAGDTLVWVAKTELMNPTIDRRLIEKALAEDPEAARAEWMAEWRQDISAFLPEEIVRSCVIPGRHELPKIAGASYFGFIDPSGGRQDSFTLGISHREKSGRVIIDVLRERVPPFRPEAVVLEYAGILKAYEVAQVQSDRYAGEWVTDSFRRQGVEVKSAELTASELFLEVLPLVSQGSVEILDSPRLISQLAGLERRTRSQGKDLITHYPGGHDDCAVAMAGACFMAGEKQSNYYFAWSAHNVR